MISHINTALKTYQTKNLQLSQERLSPHHPLAKPQTDQVSFKANGDKEKTPEVDINSLLGQADEFLNKMPGFIDSVNQSMKESEERTKGANTPAFDVADRSFKVPLEKIESLIDAADGFKNSPQWPGFPQRTDDISQDELWGQAFKEDVSLFNYASFARDEQKIDGGLDYQEQQMAASQIAYDTQPETPRKTVGITDETSKNVKNLLHTVFNPREEKINPEFDVNNNGIFDRVDARALIRFDAEGQHGITKDLVSAASDIMASDNMLAIQEAFVMKGTKVQAGNGPTDKINYTAYKDSFSAETFNQLIQKEGSVYRAFSDFGITIPYITMDKLKEADNKLTTSSDLSPNDPQGKLIKALLENDGALFKALSKINTAPNLPKDSISIGDVLRVTNNPEEADKGMITPAKIKNVITLYGV